MSGKRDWKCDEQRSPQNEPISDNSDIDFDDFQVVDEVDEAESKFETQNNEYESNKKTRSEKVQKVQKEQKDKFMEKKNSFIEKNSRETKKITKDAVLGSRHTALGVASYLQHLKENPVKKEPKTNESVVNVQEQHKKSPNRIIHKTSRSQVRRARSPPNRFKEKINNFKKFGSPVRDRNPIEQSLDPFTSERSPSVSPVRVVRYGSPDEPRYSRGSESQYQNHSPSRVNYPSNNSRNIQEENFAVEPGFTNRNYSEKYNEINYENTHHHVSQERVRSQLRGTLQRNSPFRERNPHKQSPNRIPFHRSRSPSVYDKNRSPSSHGNFNRGSPSRYDNQGRAFSPPTIRGPSIKMINERFQKSRTLKSNSPCNQRNFEMDERYSPNRRIPHGHTSREIIGRRLSTERIERYNSTRETSPARQINKNSFGRSSPHGGRSPIRGKNHLRQKDSERLPRGSPFIMQNPHKQLTQERIERFSHKHLSQERIERFSPPRERSPSQPNRNITGRNSPSRSNTFKRQSSNERFGQFGPYRSGSPKRRISKDSPHRVRSPPRKPGKERVSRFSPLRVKSPQMYKEHVRSPTGRRMRSSEERGYNRKERSSSRSPLRDREEMKSPFESSSKRFKSSMSRRSRSVSQERNMGIDETTQLALHEMKKIHDRECQRYRETPAAHPDYNVEYRKFCENKTRRVIELGGDPTCYDFATEWNTFWPKRINELFKESWLRMKEHSLRLMLEKNQKRQITMSNKNHSHSSTSRIEKEHSPNIEKKNKNDEKYESHFKGKMKPYRETRDIKDSASKVQNNKYSIAPTEELKRYDNDDLGLEEIGDSILDEIGESFSLKSKIKKAEKSSENVVSSTTSSEDINDNIIDLIKIFCKMDDKLGSLGPPIKELYIKGIELQANGVDFKRLLEDSDNKMLLQLVSSKLASLSKYETSTSVQRIVFQESKERLDKVLQKSDSDKVLQKPDSVHKEGLDIACIARATLRKETGEIVTFIRKALKYLGYENGSEEKLMKSYLEVREAQLKLSEQD